MKTTKTNEKGQRLTVKKYPPIEVVALVAFGFIFMVTLIYSVLEPHVDDVGSEYVKEYAGKPGYVLVDVRPEEVYEGASPMPGVPGGHIPGAVSFPLEDLGVAAASAALARTGIVKSKTVIVYCNTGTDSGKFADALIRSFNFSASRIKNYRGSVVDWVKSSVNELLPEGHESGKTEPEANRQQ